MPFSLNDHLRAHPWIAVALAVTGITIGSTGLLFAVAHSGFLLEDKEIWFVFDEGKEGGAGLPGNDLLQGFTEAERQTHDFFGLRHIKLLPKDDGGSIPKAAEYAKQAVAPGSNVIAVVGHLESTVMAGVIDTYLSQPFPVLMPVPTNPSLTQRTERYQNIFRLPPTDDKQAARATEFIIAHKRHRIITVIDQDNAIYSDSLVRMFSSDLAKKSANQRVDAEVVRHVAISHGIFNVRIDDALRESGADAVFFPGSPDNALVLIDAVMSLQSSGSKRPVTLPLLLMTDGVVTADFISRLREVPPDLYFTFQLPRMPDGTVGDHGIYCALVQFSNCPYGVDAVLVMRKIIQDVTTDIQEDPYLAYRTNISAMDVLGYLRKLRGAFDILPGAFGAYRFNPKGDNTVFGFTVLKPDQSHNTYAIADGG